jgi:hypothetical protein
MFFHLCRPIKLLNNESSDEYVRSATATTASAKLGAAEFEWEHSVANSDPTTTTTTTSTSKKMSIKTLWNSIF